MPNRYTSNGTMMNPPPRPVRPLSIPPINPTKIPNIAPPRSSRALRTHWGHRASRLHTRCGASLYRAPCICKCSSLPWRGRMTPSTYVESIRRTLADAGHRASLLRAMDFNCWEMFRDTVRLGRGGELLETPQFYLGY